MTGRLTFGAHCRDFERGVSWFKIRIDGVDVARAVRTGRNMWETDTWRVGEVEVRPHLERSARNLKNALMNDPDVRRILDVSAGELATSRRGSAKGK